MDLSDASSWFLVPLQILLVDLLLGADNALVIALACRRLPPQQMRQAAMIGVAGAIVIRTLLAFVASALLTLPLVKLVGAATLLLIALNLAREPHADEIHGPRPGASLWSAALVILIADTTMSLDNVVALAAIAQGNIGWLMAGVALSLPIIAFGGLMLADLLKRAPWLVEIGAALLGWIALKIAVADAVFGDAIEVNAPALAALAPAMGAAFVFAYGRLVVRGPHEPVAAPAARPREETAARRPSDARNPIAAPVPVPEAVEAAAPRHIPASFYDPGAEPEDQHEPPAVPKTREDRIAIIGVLLLAVVAGAILMVVSFLDSFN